MWPDTFATRLTSWTDLRNRVNTLPIELALLEINQWWSQTPWRPYYLHWDDQPAWPDPWQLLSDDIYCDLAKALGILYTISMLDRADMADAELVLTEDGRNLVQVTQRKYILNWNPDSVVNTNQAIKIKRRLVQSQIKKQYN
jgi:hypothetical protein